MFDYIGFYISALTATRLCTVIRSLLQLSHCN